MKPGSPFTPPSATDASSDAIGVDLCLRDVCCGLLSTQLRGSPEVLAAMLFSPKGEVLAYVGQPGLRVDVSGIVRDATNPTMTSDDLFSAILESRSRYARARTRHGMAVMLPVPGRGRMCLLGLLADQVEEEDVLEHLYDMAVLAGRLIDSI